MAKKNLATADAVTTMLQSNSVIVEVGGSIRRITLAHLIDAINAGDAELLHSVAWGVPLKQNQSSPVWGRVGNLNLWAEYKRRSGRYLVTNAGKAAKLSPISSDVYADGTTLDESKGHIMVIYPDLYYRVVTDPTTNIDYLWMSMIPIGGHVIKNPCIGAYKGSMSGSALVSRSGVAPAGSKTISAFWTAAQINGKSWGLINYDHVRFMMMLLLSEYGNPNAQSVLGDGVTGTNNSSDYITPLSFNLGSTKTLGDSFGKIDFNWTTSGGTAVTGASHVSVLGIEDPYGLQWEMIQNIYSGKSENSGQDGTEVFIYEGNRMPTSAELSTHPSGNYRQLTRPSTDGYVKTEIVGEYFDLIPSSVGGGSTSYWCDYFVQKQDVGQLVLWGGSALGGAYCGLACADSRYAFSYSNAHFGARLAYYGDIEYVNGAEL